MDFDFTFAEGTTWDQMIAFEMAGELWSEYLNDNITVNIHVEMSNTMPDNVIGGALPAIVKDVWYADFRDAYEVDATSWGDGTAITGLPLTYEYGQKKFEARVDLGSNSYIEDSNDLDMTRANAKALGLSSINPHSTELDGYIMMSDLSSSSVSWSYDPYRTASNQLDYFSVAVHEVGHILGFISGVDKSEGLYFNNQNQESRYFANNSITLNQYLDSTIDRASPMDLFRYSSESQEIDPNSNTIDMSFGSDAFFARSGQNRNWNFARGKNKNFQGDAYQASHWQNKTNENSVSGIMDPVLRTGTRRTITNRDLIVMDTIGYDLTSKSFDLLWQGNDNNGWLTANKSDELVGHVEWQAKENIAKSIYSDGQAFWVDYWKSNDPNSSAYLTSNRTNSVKNMIAKSKVYEGRRSSRGGSWQEAYFSEFSWQELNEPMSQSIIVDYVIDNFSVIEAKSEEIAPESSNNDSFFNSAYSVKETELQLLSTSDYDAIANNKSDFAILQGLIGEMSKLSLEEVTL